MFMAFITRRVDLPSTEGRGLQVQGRALAILSLRGLFSSVEWVRRQLDMQVWSSKSDQHIESI